MNIKKILPFVIFCLSSKLWAEQTVLLKVEGIDDKALYRNVRIHLSQLSNDIADGSDRYQYLVQQAVDKGLRAMGYYNSQYQFNLTARPRPQKDLLKLTVQLDKPVRLDKRDIQVIGEAKQDEEFTQLIQKNTPEKGVVLNHETYDDIKSNIDKLAQSKGYFDGQWQYNRLEVYPTEYVADWRLGYDSGVRYRYGLIRFKDNQINEEYLTNILRIKSGEFYHINDLSKLSSDFSSSNWFTSVLVDPDINEVDKVVDLDVLVRPKKRNEMTIGLGYATDIGPRLQFKWKKPWINEYGHSLEMNNYFSKPEQNIEVGYNIPIKSNPLHYYYQILGGMEREDQSDIRSISAKLGFQRFWNHETGWVFSLGVRTRYDAFEQGEEKRRTLLVYPTASLTRIRSDGNRFPLWGDSQKLTVNWGHKVVGSNVNFYSVKLSSAWVRTFWDKHRFYLRAELGALKASEFSRIPPTLRYFAGGDMSVRGFGYKKISPRNKNGKLIGGAYLMTSTAEYQYQVYPDWWAAVFYDVGFAANHFDFNQLRSGSGIGVRWASPIGAIKFDLAIPVKSPNKEKGIQFYIGLGAEL
ncbi:autotransporter secretion outer membrane protein TamA [Nicoletella semolina]|uniref:Translocation and assembly module subunit TamA n=1 Tax=Nicoletella semolina TaxID=271160 RepID=A0A4R2N9B5_9PAST|nr:autotransporter assembly complex family protein [Nicoletella semolina]MDH2925517.1 hypothetical protein [Nicoletella semolina]TCP17592.1 autotransporter secretion outer membrane protein TamA [Nicoletella semolina]